MHHLTLLRILSPILLLSTSLTLAYEMHCRCHHDGTTLADLTNQCCGQQKATFQINYSMSDAECSKDVLKFDINEFFNCCQHGNASTSCWAVE
ncbi:hypothetical protein VTL71DRAFT_2583 [Oculimacula yallundae]|uniref:Plethodontid modulating factor n=1 Tax=Oculimacula yallundae TaxID=86028 RepID=A0ABR4CAG7_9HELO